MQSNTPVSVKRHSNEMPLFIISLLISLPIIIVLIVSIIGLVYGLIFAALIFLGHLSAISHIRGSGIRVTSEQLPELYREVEVITHRLGLDHIPEIYVVNGNGILNAFITKFLFSRILVIHSDVIDACEDNVGARAMVIGHELGHLRAGHLRWSWLIWPSHIIPFLSGALSRAREYTADRYGLVCANSKEDALHGLLILAGGKKIAKKVSVDLFVAQINLLNKGWMRIGEWMQTHPVLARRIYAISRDATNQQPKFSSTSGSIKGVLILLPIYAVFAALMIAFGIGFTKGIQEGIAKSATAKEQQENVSKLPDSYLE